MLILVASFSPFLFSFAHIDAVSSLTVHFKSEEEANQVALDCHSDPPYEWIGSSSNGSRGRRCGGDRFAVGLSDPPTQFIHVLSSRTRLRFD